MLRHAALALLAAGSPLLLTALIVDGAWGEWALAALAAVFPWALVALAVSRGGLRLAGWLAALLALVAGCLLGSVGLSGETGRDLWLGGFPAATALLVYGAGLGALVLTGVAYAVTFPGGRR